MKIRCGAADRANDFLHADKFERNIHEGPNLLFFFFFFKLSIWEFPFPELFYRNSSVRSDRGEKAIRHKKWEINEAEPTKLVTWLHRSQVNGKKSSCRHSLTLQCFFPRLGNVGVPVQSTKRGLIAESCSIERRNQIASRLLAKRRSCSPDARSAKNSISSPKDAEL